MILQLGNILEPFAGYAALFLVFLGVMWLIFGIYEGRRRGSFKERKVKDWDYKITTILKVITFLGFIVGILGIIVGISGVYYDVPPSIAYGEKVADKGSYFTSIILIVLGILTFLKPMNDLPISSMIALLIATVATIFVIIIIPAEIFATLEIWGITIIIVIILIIVFCITAVIAKFYATALMGVSKAISWPPLAIIISIFCFIQGFLLLVNGISIVPL